MSKEFKLAHQRVTKSINSLMGIVSGLISDGELNDKEIIYLKTWCTENIEIAKEYPANIIFRRITEVLADGVITEAERNHLVHEFQNLTGNDFSETGSALPGHIAAVFDDDPTVIIEDNEFVFTGNFLFGTRAACLRAVTSRGGRAKDNVTKQTNYLVVGSRSSPDWIAENFGRKIQKAAEMADSGEYEISIIREADWAMQIKPNNFKLSYS